MKTVGKTQYAEWNFKGLKQLEDNLKKNYYVDIGIFDESDSRSNKGNSDIGNASLGAIHEFGSVSGGIPARSWLRMPTRKLVQEYKKFIQADKQAFVDALTAKRGERKFFTALGKWGVKVIKRAFNTSGYGSWAKNAPSTMLKKKRNTPLKDTNQLRDAVSYRVGNYGK